MGSILRAGNGSGVDCVRRETIIPGLTSGR